MTIVEMLQNAQYSRITVGDRWLICTAKGFEVLERKRHAKHTKRIIDTFDEHEAVNELLKGEELYSDLVK